MFRRNYCEKCGTRIPRTKRAFYGNKYKPVVCMECAEGSSIAAYGSRERYELAMWAARRVEEEKDATDFWYTPKWWEVKNGRRVPRRSR